jgi:Arc/MetJ-type ribon-helix-helix transcriptional regulator
MQPVMQIACQLPTEDVAAIDALVPDRFPSRAAAIRAAVELWLREERERAVDAAYARAYGELAQSPAERALADAAAGAATEALRRADLDW